MKLLSAVVVCLVVALSAGAADDPLKAGPSIYQMKFENERVRALVAEFKPGASISLHRHPDHLAYVLQGGTLHVTGADGKMQVFELKEGESVYLPAQAHSAMNPGKSTVRVLVVELK